MCQCSSGHHSIIKDTVLPARLRLYSVPDGRDGSSVVRDLLDIHWEQPATSSPAGTQVRGVRYRGITAASNRFTDDVPKGKVKQGKTKTAKCPNAGLFYTLNM